MTKTWVLSLLAAGIALAAACTYQAGAPTTLQPTAVPASKDQPTGKEPAWQQRWEKLMEGAKKEGSLTLYSTLGNEGRKAMEDGIKKRFGLSVEFVSGLGAGIAQKVITEKQAGLYLADVFVMGADTLLSSVKPGMILAPMEPVLILPEVRDEQSWIGGKLPFLEKDRMVINISASFDTYVTFNTDFIKADEITSYYDLLNPKFKGKIAMFDPTIGGAGKSAVAHIAHVLSQAEGNKLIQGLVKQEPVISNNYRQLAEWLARGKYPLALGSRIEETQYFRSLGAPILLARPKEGGKVGSAGGSMGLAARPAHPEAAVLFVNWVLSKEGGTAFQSGKAIPSGRLDVPKDFTDPHAPRPDDRLYIEDEAAIAEKDAMADFIRDVFRALKS
ncbi:MAG: extracellular solute-binding protein [Chloroflexi bacterium]|nr:extracellular solute-binding protein [Chloroflexota bacterium]